MTSISCSECRELLGAHGDDALRPDELLIVEAHLAKCQRCRDEQGELRALSARIKAAGGHTLPPHLVAAIDAAIDSEAANRARGRPRWPIRSFGALAASHIAIAGIAAAAALQIGWTMRGRDEVLREAVSAHVRAQLTEQLVQVASSDQHTVKPWLASKLTFSPIVRDFAAEGFPLAGARVEVIGNRPVGALVYTRRAHRITVLVAPAGQVPELAGMSSAENGYNALGWKEGAFDYLAVSDLNRDELREFTALAQHPSGG